MLVSTPDVLGQAKAFRENAQYLLNPVDTKLFYLKSLPPPEEKLKVLIASDSNWHVKGTDIAIRAVNKNKEKVEVSIIGYGRDFHKTLTLASSFGLRLTVLSKVSHERIREYYWNVDVVIDRFKLGLTRMVLLEVIASDRPIITYVSSGFPEYRDFPLKNVKTEEDIIGVIEKTISKLWKVQHSYLTKNHIRMLFSKKLLDVYESLI